MLDTVNKYINEIEVL